MKKPLAVVCCVIIICSLLAVLLLLKPAPPTSQGEPQTTPQSISLPTPQPTLQATSPSPSAQQPTNRTLKQAVGNATDYLTQIYDPTALLFLNILYRQFGITEFKDSLQTFDEVSGYQDNPMMRIWRRIADYSNPVNQTDFKAISNNLDALTVPALYSDRLALPDNYLSTLTDAANSGPGYLLTHALLATIWLHDNHCNLQMPDNFEESLYQANAALIGNGSVVTDLEMEAAAFLYEAGQGKLVNDAFVQRVIATQNYDGGWSESGNTIDPSYWHPSVLGLMLLLHIEFPASSYPPMIAPAPDYTGACANPTAVFSITICLFCLVYMRKRLLQSLPEGAGSPISRMPATTEGGLTLKNYFRAGFLNLPFSFF